MNIITASEFLQYRKKTTSLPLGEVIPIVEKVRECGDSALMEFNRQFDNYSMPIRNCLYDAHDACEEFTLLKPYIQQASDAIRRFAEKQLKQCCDFSYETFPGVVCSQRVIPIESAGIYVPAGRYPLVSSVLMGVIPAVVAGVKRIAVCSPPSKVGVSPLIAATAFYAGATECFPVGGAQAIAALAYGTDTISPVDMISGPGNSYVTAAKKYVYGDVGIDFCAGPTELCIIADESADCTFIAADMVAQAEHDPNASAVLITTSRDLADSVLRVLNIHIDLLPDPMIARESLETNGYIVIVDSVDEACRCADRMAPEHLSIQTTDAASTAKQVSKYGSLFIGYTTAEAYGDYAAGINHTLPTNGSARFTGGVSVRNFLTFRTTLEMTREGMIQIADTASRLACAEGLIGHANSVKIRR